ncbi:16S rRNA (guanine527-N7)-methyltransferase [Williamsoniiplasma somnilux]|uniref:Ribosomal RNA small subunit methyltransferase G n=1 Tax=Williamsoniiplasma somnilux TaxID=215578 RepID=A0A2K8NZ17_9MOLU|nr:16S rRNA (guanine(527)-N(7))-methyltransferase RsmG [Williamsoniiplasma somnilux]ATZ18458.1 16S rRNA (guanine527-N7)-methyltransferase [Williamsoniiplasma somnilux]
MSFNNWSIFKKCKNIVLTEDIKNKLQKYYDILIRENTKYNLTRIISIDDVYEKHFLDSLLFTEAFNLQNQKIADIGSGPGFPGVVIKIFFPNTKILLIESNNKKANFLRTLIKELDLKGINVADQRAEDLSFQLKETFDIVISRAVAYLDIILEIGVQLLKIEGHYILLKGPRAEQEIIDLKNKDLKMGLKLENKQTLEDTGFGIRINLFYKKFQSTASIYPRSYAQIKKESK